MCMYTYCMLLYVDAKFCFYITILHIILHLVSHLIILTAVCIHYNTPVKSIIIIIS